MKGKWPLLSDLEHSSYLHARLLLDPLAKFLVYRHDNGRRIHKYYELIHNLVYSSLQPQLHHETYDTAPCYATQKIPLWHTLASVSAQF